MMYSQSLFRRPLIPQQLSSSLLLLLLLYPGSLHIEMSKYKRGHLVAIGSTSSDSEPDAKIRASGRLADSIRSYEDDAEDTT